MPVQVPGGWRHWLPDGDPGLATIRAAFKYWYVVMPALAVIVLFVMAHHNVDRMTMRAL
ncbi:MAG: hypothetical protein ACRDRO_25430 [Pseudonocardiaceae bacterium]